jgi:hypothetical protein
MEGNMRFHEKHFESAGKKRYVLQDCEDGTLGEVETDRELCELVAFACSGHDYMLREV